MALYRCALIDSSEVVRQRGRPRKTWKEVVDKDMPDLELKPGDAMDHSRPMTQIKGYWCSGN